jgi:GDPmannose 4,6-dehydratase
MYACNGILFNHESPRRGETFVTRKISCGLARINECLDNCLYVGNLDARRDWGHARDDVEMQWRMLEQEGPPEDFVIATGRQESVRRFIELTALELGWGALEWQGEGLEEIGERSTGEMVAAGKEEARKEAILRLKGFKVVGSMENPPTNPVAVEQARGGQG